MRYIYASLLTFLITLVTAISTFGQTITLPVDEFNPGDVQKENGDNPTWNLLKLGADNLTNYSLLTDKNGNKVIKAAADNAASGLIYEVNIDPKKYQVIEWRWKIKQVLPNGDLRKKEGDDYPARIYITFDYDKTNLSFDDRMKYAALKTFTSYMIPLRSLNYIWANKAEPGTIAPNPFTDWVQMVAVKSGNKKAGIWITESRNIYQDYKKAFGEEPPPINGVAIMTDSDNTQGNAVAYYGDITFKKATTDSTEY